ncbi:hypothetical protein ACFO0D_01540 [Deinococcus hohokamensis]|uniref:CopG family transcriptional regulator n=1 Tax=Deinococcus hohokamensis TaxID=309883 RepID=A0ABV9I3R2_9DEIO
MGVGKGTGKGGARSGSGPKLAVPAGEGNKVRVTVALGAELLEQVRRAQPNLAEMSEQDLVRAAVWMASGQSIPIVH